MIKKLLILAILFIVLFSLPLYAADITPNGYGTADLVSLQYDLREAAVTRILATPGIGAATGDPAHIKITNTVQAIKDGVFYSITAATGTDDVILTADVQNTTETKLYVFSYDVVNSTTEVTVGAVGDTDVTNVVIPADNIFMGYAKVVCATVPFTLGTTSFAASGLTTTFYNMAVRPPKVNVIKY